ncbi:MAG: hypothetical protein K2O40_14015 [Lachnospiraceae bacterium]|nr:hypothetical protein [Lachnospiraceae bacterium]
MKKKCIYILLCTAVVLTGCTGQNNQKQEDGQEIVTIDFNDTIQNNELQNNESELSAASQQYQENNANNATAENDNYTESSPQETADNINQNETTQDLYAGFLKNEVPVTVASDYPQQDYVIYNLEPGKSYTFSALGEFVNKRYFNPEYSTKTSYDYAQYVYLDSSNSSAKKLLVKFSGLGIYSPDDDSFAVYVITENNGQLYLTDSYECWARSFTKACRNGLFVSDGSTGAGDHYAGVSALTDTGKIEEIYGTEILTGSWASYVSNETIYYEIFAGNEDIVFSVMIYTIGEKMFYTYDLSECTDNQISICETYINRCRDEIGIEWVTQEVVEEAIKERCSLLGVDYNAIDQTEEAEWVGIEG